MESAKSILLTNRFLRQCYDWPLWSHKSKRSTALSQHWCKQSVQIKKALSSVFIDPPLAVNKQLLGWSTQITTCIYNMWEHLGVLNTKYFLHGSILVMLRWNMEITFKGVVQHKMKIVSRFSPSCHSKPNYFKKKFFFFYPYNEMWIALPCYLSKPNTEFHYNNFFLDIFYWWII